jgi:Ca2+-binding RTX toxin-like protein
MVGVDVNSYLAAATPSSVSGMTATSAEAEFGESWSIDFLDPFPGADRNILLDGYGDLLLNPVVNFIDINLTSGNDIFRTGHGDDRIFGNAGADTIEAHGGDDTLSGGSGSDQLFGGDGFDFADYSGGGEQAQNQPAQGIRAAFSINSDNALVGTVTDSWGATDQLNGIEFLIATNSDDRLRIIGDADDVFWSSNQQLEATGGGNTALGDVLDLSDLLTSSGVDVVWAADGVIEVRQSGTFGIITVDDFENIIGSTGADRISGNNQANGINGNTGADELFGGSGDDFIFFDAEDTVVNGGAGRDVGCALTGDPIMATRHRLGPFRPSPRCRGVGGQTQTGRGARRVSVGRGLTGLTYISRLRICGGVLMFAEVMFHAFLQNGGDLLCNSPIFRSRIRGPDLPRESHTA